MKLRYGVCVNFDRLAAAAEAGFDYIEPSLTLVAMASEQEYAEMVRAVDASPIKAEAFNCFFFGDFRLVGPEATPLPVLVEYAEGALSRASRLGGKLAVVGSGSARRAPEGYPKEKAMAQLAALLRALGEVAQKYGMRVVVEPLNGNETNLITTVAGGLAVAKTADHPAVGALADFYHMAKENDSLDSIRTAGNTLLHLHIAGPETRTMTELRACPDTVARWADAVRAAGYEGRLSLEGGYEADFLADITATRTFLTQFFGE